MLAIMVIDLQCHRKIGIGGEIGCHYVAELCKPRRVGVDIRPNPSELIVVEEEMNALSLSIRDPLEGMKRYKLALPVPTCRHYLRNIIITDTRENALL